MSNTIHKIADKFLSASTAWSRDLIVLTLLIGFLFSIFLGSRPFNTPDEGRYAEVAREMLVSHDFITLKVNGIKFFDKPPLVYWLQAVSIKMFGVNEWSLRAVPALLALFGCLAVYMAARKLFDRQTGWFAAILLATSQLYFCTAHYINMDMAVAVLITCCLLAFLLACNEINQRSRTGLFILTFIFSALATLAKGLIGIVIPGLIAGIWLMVTRQWRALTWRPIVIGLLVYCVITLPWFIAVQQANPEFFHYFFIYQHFERFLSTTGFNNPMPIWFYLPVVFGLFFPVSLFLPRAIYQLFWKAEKVPADELFFLLWFTIVIVFFSIPQSKILSYILPAFPPIAILVARYLKQVWQYNRWIEIRWEIILAIAITFILGVALWLIPISGKFVTLHGKSASYFYQLATVLISGAILAVIFYYQRKFFRALITLVLVMTISLIVLLRAIPYYIDDSVKPVAMHLKPLLQPQDTVINLYDYFYDLPLYLERQIVVVEDWRPETIVSDNWKMQFIKAGQYQDTHAWLITENEFWKRWNSTNHLYVVIDERALQRLAKRHPFKYHLVFEANKIVAITNHKGDNKL